MQYSNLPLRAKNAGSYGEDVWPGDLITFAVKYHPIGSPEETSEYEEFGRVVCSIEPDVSNNWKACLLVLKIGDNYRHAYHCWVDPDSVRKVLNVAEVSAMLGWLLGSDFPTSKPEMAVALSKYGTLNGDTLSDPTKAAESIARATRNVTDEDVRQLPTDRYQLTHISPGCYAEPGEGSAWTLNSEHDIPVEVEHSRGPFASIVGVRAPVVDSKGGLYPPRRLQKCREEGYAVHGEVSLGGVKCRAFTSSVMFQRADGTLVSVGVLLATPHV